ncbi:hypothetical protein [Caballeronia sp. ATUFL_M1_KS5A]|uniref:hypothetical protein n=1 Tax=Caballeronia sp. ATUFL_M1_KS5A TaxID=2921778 RepID=UPI002028FD2D|nr:hypothetical protein [Caballeronia sp. ATUFL_M1_KS5A]
MDLLSNSVAAQTLDESLPGKSVDHWMTWLQNNRNQARKVAYRIPFERMAGGVFYLQEEIESFIEWEKGRQIGTVRLSARAAEAVHAFGIDEKTGSATGRRLNVSAVLPLVDESTGQPFIRVIATDPLLVFRLEPGEAASLASELLEASQVCMRVSK